MNKEQKRYIQLMMSPVFGCEPEDIEVEDGHAFVKQPERLNEKVHVWNVECDSPNSENK